MNLKIIPHAFVFEVIVEKTGAFIHLPGATTDETILLIRLEAEIDNPLIEGVKLIEQSLHYSGP